MNNVFTNNGTYVPSNTIDATAISSKSAVMSEIYNEISNQLFHTENRNISPDTKNRVVFKNGKIIAELYENGCMTDSHTIITDIDDVKIYPDQSNPRVVEVFFSDGTSEKSTLDSNDEFNLDSGITYCIVKKFISAISGSNYSTSILNKIVRHARQVMDANEKDHQKMLEYERLEEARKAKIIEKKQRRDAKRDAENREAFICLLEEAIIRANKTMQESKGQVI